jgi:hypothetical protein
MVSQREDIAKYHDSITDPTGKYEESDSNPIDWKSKEFLKENPCTKS